MSTKMVRIYDPVLITHPNLREFAFQAAWISVVTEPADYLEDLNIDVAHAERLLPDFSTPWPWEFDAVTVAVTILRRNRDAAVLDLDEALTRWLRDDPEHWPLVWSTLLEPWQERPGIWSEDTPDWIRSLATIGEAAQGRNERYGRGPDGAGGH